MKKILALLLCAALLCGFGACSEDEQPQAEATDTIRVGYCRVDITPEESVPMRGYANASQRWSTYVLDPITATCLAFSDAEDNTVILFSFDHCTATGDVLVYIRKEISDKTGVPFQNIHMSATHTHSSPELLLSTEYPSVENYKELMHERMVEAALTAMEDRSECKMEGNSVNPVGLNFVRHYIMDDGSVVGDGFGEVEGKSYVGHVSEVDNQLQVVRFVREDKKDIVMVNFQTHPLRASEGNGGLDTRLSADIVGSMRDYIEPQINCDFIYFTGASGNVDPSSRLGSENAAGDYVQQGQLLAQHAIMALNNMTEIPGGKVEAIQRDVGVKIRENVSELRLVTCRVGELAFASPCYEMFDSNGKYVKDNSPFAMTFITYLTDSSSGYVAAESAYRYGGYEVEYVGYRKGTAEVLADNFVDMLYELYGTQNPNGIRELPDEE